ncbi:RagB/SusD family nutrient uptake outer membrane protein [Lacibacter sp.]|uniref:RagB/SusD family nutrient uptake outer membrane protein n=1 Tax=Lacibacter sp. TaxID=1915409 RepID=UPI002B4ACC7C|nr:RagB/SusD family nutrient uptake outer membrane protein [Lacibacter sp.]HLP39556.1 RagB/SusD family nutrient uptake outer membrane protein [Lacibacter sp.]
MKYILLVLACITLLSCKKFLDKKSNQKLVIPSTVQDLQGLLDQYTRVNQFNPGAAEKSADDYYLTQSDWAALATIPDQRTYIWEKDFLFVTGTNDWSNLFANVYKANLIINEMPNIPLSAGTLEERNACLGHAYFIRANSFLQGLAIWSPAYDPVTASTDLGMPLRLHPEFNSPSVRSSVKQSYEQVLKDAKQAAAMLPETALHLLRPCKPAALALVARTYLFMGNYDSCLYYSDWALSIKNNIKDYNQLNASTTYPFDPRFSNPEVLYDCYTASGSILNNARAKIDSNLYRSYHANDLRKTIFFRNNNNGTYGFRGSYSGVINLFNGFAVDELYLMKAECEARKNNAMEAMNTLNTLLIKRWKTGTFIPYTAATKEEAIEKILLERRKELLMRSIRWIDIKRLNKQGASISLTRILGSNTYLLPPNDLRFALPIPETVIELTGMVQNPR